MRKIDDFFIKEHNILVENLNRISDDLLKAKWYFLASISAIGLAYSYIFKDNWSISGNFFDFIDYYIDLKLVTAPVNHIDNSYKIFIVCIIGNIIFWLINEYVLSHGFLFRYIQAKAAKKEKYFNTISYFGKDILHIDKLIKDPTDKEMFLNIDNKELEADFFLPDQFLPIYWATIWIILINSVFAIILIKNGYDIFKYAIAIFALALISKIFAYHIYKIRKFIATLCVFDVLVSGNKKHNQFYEFPSSSDYFIYGGCFTILLSLLVIIIDKLYELCFNIPLIIMPFHKSIFVAMIVWFYSFPLFCLIVHIIRFILQAYPIDQHPPKYYENRDIYIDLRTKILWKLHWYYWLAIMII
jgi:hypothetical protein